MKPVLVIAVLAAAAACSTPPLKLELAVSDSLDDSCGAAACTGVILTCDAVASIRILDPNEPSAPYISECQAILPDNKHDLCSLAHLKLDQIPLPEQTLEVQVVVYPATAIPTDPMTGLLICPTEKEGLRFNAATGFPSGPIAMPDPVDPTHTYHVEPAIGGRAFYHKGDSETVVSLACNDLQSLNDSTCLGANSVVVQATIDDFDGNMPVDSATADRFTVRIGEPQFDSAGTGDYVLNPTDARVLDRTSAGTPSWAANIDLKFEQAACLEVLEDGAQTTATLTCKPVSLAPMSVDILGYRLASNTLTKILAALGGDSQTILDNGLVVGIVYNDKDLPASNAQISVTQPSGLPMPTIEFLDANLASVVPGGTATTTSGIFVSRDAPFGTTFSTRNAPNAFPGEITGYGGVVEGKVTLIVLSQTQIPNQ